MALEKMIVSATKVGNGSDAKFPYEFYAKKTSRDQNTYVIQLIMPLGGKESGLFRYPKDGETILVDMGGTAGNCLLGYFPSESEAVNNFLTNTASSNSDEKNALQNEAGMVLRYEQTGKSTAPAYDAEDTSGRYSEIGFYHRPTQWEPSKKDDYVDTTDIPRIDHLNIQSSGDIHSKAVNHHRMKAKRIEILSNVDASNFSKELKGNNRPFGDKGADVSELLQGDIHIRGSRRIVLKAGSEIRLEVGRSTIVISDAGIILTTRKTHSDIHNSLDTVLSVLPRDGITMFGQHLKLAAAYDWAILENMGSSIKGTAGIMRLEGKDIKASTISGGAYIANFAAQTAAFIDNLVSMSVGTHDSDDIQESALPAYAGTFAGVGSTLAGVIIGLVAGGTGNTDDPDSKIVKFAALAIQMTETVVGVIETVYISPEDKIGKDALALAGIIAEWGCLLPIFIAICLASEGPFLLHNDSVHLGNNGYLTMVGTYIKQFSLNYKFTNSPLSGLTPPPKDERKWYKKFLDFAKDHWWQFGLGALGVAGAGGVGAKFTLDRKGSLSEAQGKLLGELNAL
jgi:hypothetical protein